RSRSYQVEMYEESIKDNIIAVMGTGSGKTHVYVQMRLLVGSDGVEHWSDQETWDIVLRNFRIVVSTHAVLADALSHGFVTMERLALLIFDEGMT
ncbi:hypothetical protein DL95DRAFT_271059, partial [Leptodontidium sp. 2 PMI_412]